MQNSMKVTLLGAKRGSVDGNKYASIYITSPTDINDRDRVGVLPVQMSCDYDMLDTLDRKQVPGDYDVMVNIKPGAGGKVTMHATSCRFVSMGGKHTPSAGA